MTFITSQSEFEQLCLQIKSAGLVAFDTEFVSEYTYKPELCLLQFATTDLLAAVDPFEVKDLSPWWEIMGDDETIVVVHGGQAEVKFCLWMHNQKPRHLVDVQLAEGLLSRAYPLSYQNLVRRVLGKKVHSKETRTDWRRRPLSEHQIKYALEDVEYVLEVWTKQQEQLKSLNRLEWIEEEVERYMVNLTDEIKQQGWCKLSGIHKLSSRNLAVAILIYEWREQKAEELNKPVRRILRDDLLIDMARRMPGSHKELLATRDMNRSDYKCFLDDFLDCVQAGRAMPADELPPEMSSAVNHRDKEEHVLGKLLAIALANRCAEMNVAMSLVATSADLRHLVRWHVNGEKDSIPAVTQGWRKEVCGDLLEDLLDGKISLRVSDPESTYPLVFEQRDTKQ